MGSKLQIFKPDARGRLRPLAWIDKQKGAAPMALRVERLVAGDGIVELHVSGRIEAEHVDTLRKLIEQENGKVIIDLREVTLVNCEAISFLALSEQNGVELRNCPGYIGEWIARKRSQK
jgi:hypothetical protein